jgi:hypothetical protein
MVNLINFEILEKYTKIVGLEELLNIFPIYLKENCWKSFSRCKEIIWIGINLKFFML